MSESLRVKRIFTSSGFPEITYVVRTPDSSTATGNTESHEEQLEDGIDDGNLCLLTGSSKTGKTTLYKKVLKNLQLVPLVVRCDQNLTSTEIWKNALEQINFSRISKRDAAEGTSSYATGELSSKLGWNWLASMTGKVSVGISKNSSEQETREKVLAEPSPSHLVPILKESNAFLVIEDFHYLSSDVQRTIFQQWKMFVDERIAILVVGTTHHGVDLAYANSDLTGRIQHIDLKSWNPDELHEIARKGFSFLNIRMPIEAIRTLTREAAGLPIVMQQACAELFILKGHREIERSSSIIFSVQDSYNSLHQVATTKYSQFESWYERLSAGPRKGARRYDTYEIVLSTFTLNPPVFELDRPSIDARINSLPLDPTEIPPAPSINSTLGALHKFQEANGFYILEWSARDNKIYIVEPAFLFYLRWREKRSSAPNNVKETFDLLRSILGPRARDGNE